MEGGLTGLYYCKHTNYYRDFRLQRVLFCYQTRMLHQATSGSGSLILLVESKQASRQSLHASHASLPCSILLPETLSWASSARDSFAHTVDNGRLLIVMSMSNLNSLTNAMITARLKIELHSQGYGGWGKGLNKFYGQYRYSPGIHHLLTTKFADVAALQQPCD